MAKYELMINGEAAVIEAAADMPLLWALRDLQGLTGTKYGCGIGQCGACTVHVNGAPTRSCLLPLSAAAGASVTTIEGLADGGQLSAVQKVWIETDVAQCGYCQAGQIMSATALLNVNPSPSDEDIDQAMSGNYCRCGTYIRIREAVHAAAAYYNAGDKA
ncbi:MAG: (2Fe-2S)-binding protein [Gammaproteobacteria bacterium]|jgi:isoquinoline 1-oxidoreductase alpha subunit|nr:(2Fe-2S)-binding protein [Gammaproteobacteria bacterium]MDA0825507.1 (2Fe-2S)-binding protein [Pseudomonadota bacterium]MDB2706950.1 (2Fe-2S)-binding protein [Pseudomonadales bacterium]MCH9819425.1 (2Fe-2S)-binding protein [Gammaproteobacteria bacterium]MCO4830090.1 (2Fe-2S)-binding protein [Gammaproteobacteria bacterium]